MKGTAVLSALALASVASASEPSTWYTELCGETKCLHNYCPEGLTDSQALIVETDGTSDNVNFAFDQMNQYRERLCQALSSGMRTPQIDLDGESNCGENDIFCLKNVLDGHVANFNLALENDPYTLVLVDTADMKEEDEEEEEDNHRRQLQMSTLARPSSVAFGAPSTIRKSNRVYKSAMRSQVRKGLRVDAFSYGNTRKSIHDMSMGKVTPLNRHINGHMEVSKGWNAPAADSKYSNSMSRMSTKLSSLSIDDLDFTPNEEALDILRANIVGTFTNQIQREGSIADSIDNPVGEDAPSIPMAYLSSDEITAQAIDLVKENGMDVMYTHEVLCFNEPEMKDNVFTLNAAANCVRSIVQYQELADGNIKVTKYYVPDGFAEGSKFAISKLSERINYKETILVKSSNQWQVRTSATAGGKNFVTYENIHFNENMKIESRTVQIANQAVFDFEKNIWNPIDSVDFEFTPSLSEQIPLHQIPQALKYLDESREVEYAMNPPADYTFTTEDSKKDEDILFPEEEEEIALPEGAEDAAKKAIEDASTDIINESIDNKQEEAVAVFMVTPSGEEKAAPNTKSLSLVSAIAMVAMAPIAFGKTIMKKLPAGFAIDLGLIFAFVGWYLGNYQYNIANKAALTAAGGAGGYPMTISVLQLAVGMIYALFMWAAPDGRPKPKVTASDIKSMIPVSFCAMGAHVASVLCLSAGAVSFGQIVKAAEPVFAALIGLLVYKKSISKAKWLALIPVIGGVALASMADLSFGIAALAAGCVANMFAAFKGNENKKLMETEGIKDRIGSVGNQYALTTIMATIFALPIMIITEGAKLGSFIPMLQANPSLLFNIVASGLWFYGYNELSTLTVKKTSAVTMSVANTAKRVIVIVGVAIALGESLAPLKMIGCAIGIGGVFLYSVIDQLVEKFNAKKGNSNDDKQEPLIASTV